MATEIIMPDLGTTTDEVRVLRWLIEEGQPVTLGQALLEVETDKANMEVEAVTAGRLVSVKVGAGESARAGDTIALVEPAQNDASARVAPPVEKRPKVNASPRQSRVSPPPSSGPRRGWLAGNRARRAAGSAFAGSARSIPLSRVQQTVAERMQQSKQTVPHFYITMTADARAMIARRESKAGPALWDAFFAQAASHALREFERMRGLIDGDHLMIRPHPAVGVAVDVNGDLYVVPLDDARSRSPEAISRAIRSAADSLRQGGALPGSPHPVCLTVSNLGAAGVESFGAIVDPSQASVLAVGAVAQAVVVEGDGIVVRPQVKLTLSVDHRVANGKYAAAFLKRIIELIESISEAPDE